MERINGVWWYTEETRKAASDQFGCTCDSCCAAIAGHPDHPDHPDPDRVRQTIDRLISNLPEAVSELKSMSLTSLARQIQNDLENLVYWQKKGGLTEERYRLISGASVLSDDGKRSLPIYIKEEEDGNEN